MRFSIFTNLVRQERQVVDVDVYQLILVCAFYSIEGEIKGG